MEDNQVRRLPVVDDAGRCCGIVSQADIARHAGEHQTGDLVREVSEPAQ
ncbi:CBS domain-containing protein [Qipengyuania sp. YIM B01966]|nr:CBS domain-containing protein [Qipengyuania sp. YIM B01966]